jgi:hypothetical protein
MGCRIGITTDLETRKAHWEGKYKNFRDWHIMAGPYTDKSIAQLKETELAKEHNCEAHAGGADSSDPNAKWYVYGFNHDGKK